ncbi:MAG: T9SS type A sorting domain-containing protein [Candidatus Desantisbacteria bacterium]
MVKVVDVYNNPCPGVDIDWQVIHAPSGATGYSILPATTTTNIQGMASSTLTLGTEPPGTYAISAICPGLSGSPILFTASSLRRFGTIAGFCVLRLGLNRYGTHCADIQVKILETGATMTTDNNSYFTFSHIPVGVYTLKFDTWGASCATLNTVNISPTQFEDTTYIGTMSLLAGDINDDGGIDISDWPLFGSAWREGATSTNSEWLSYREADFDHNQEVLAPDFVVLGNNFNKTQGLFGGLRAPSMSRVQPMQEAMPLMANAISSGQTELSFDLSTLEGVDIKDLRVGNIIYLKITISDATDFMAGEVHLSFNPDVLEVIGLPSERGGIQIQPGTYPVGSVWPLINNADNSLGKIDYAVGVLDPQTEDGGLFATVPFRIKAYGVTAKVEFDFAPEENRTTKFVETPKAVANKPVNLINLPPVEIQMEKQEVSVVIPMRYSNVDNTRVYPNPVTAGQTITFDQFTADKEVTIKIYTISGELVMELPPAKNKVPWTVPTSLASGIYLYLINDHAGSIKQGKIGIIK